MNYIDFLRQSARERKSIACLGMDPIIEKIPIQENDVEKKIVQFYSNILDACASENVFPGACKPNYAYYAQYGWPGLRALEKVCEMVREKNIPLILDAKRGDIGTTSAAYAKEVFGFWNVDCVTIAPYMGVDSVQPFIEWAEKHGKGVYILNRTSNPGAKELQNLVLEETQKPLYEKVARHILNWGKNAQGNVGAVVGATNIQEFQEIHSLFSANSLPVPYLIPGVGGQGGSAVEVMRVLKENGKDVSIHRINSSSGINYAYAKAQTTDYAGAAVKALQELNREIGLHI
jgi:orotidine-5'-phosphate decarboxylase